MNFLFQSCVLSILIDVEWRLQCYRRCILCPCHLGDLQRGHLSHSIPGELLCLSNQWQQYTERASLAYSVWQTMPWVHQIRNVSIQGQCVFIHISEFFCRIQWTIQSRHVFAWFLQEQKCFIENVCYDIGALNPSNSSLFCNPYENFEEWSIKRGKSSEKDDFLISYIRDKNLLIIRACINSADDQHN